MILLGLLIVPLVAGPLAFFLRRRPLMEVVNLAAFAVLLGLAGHTGFSGTSPWHGFALEWIPLRGRSQRLGSALVRFRGLRMLHLRDRLLSSG